MIEQKIGKEKIQPMNFRGRIICYRPGGNDTALILNETVDFLTKKAINDFFMGIYPNIEQVGFISLVSNDVQLNMAGGEFCGNATRSTADLALKSQPGNLTIKVSGVESTLKSGVTADGEAYAQMPVYSDISKVKKDPENRLGWIVEMEGITHYVDFNSEKITGLTNEEIKELAFLTIKEKGLENFPASGIIYVRELENKSLQITPVVYVKDIDTLFLETACGSGTCALGQVMAIKNQVSVYELPILQPSGEVIKISVEYKDKEFKYAQIQGEVKKLSEGIIRTDAENSFYIIESLNSKTFTDSLTRNNIIQLYKDIFKEEPYFESFTDGEVAGYFEEYIEKGIVLIARNKQGIVGFSAVLPLNTQQEISDLANQFGINSGNCQYVAELGVKKDSRRKQIGQGLIEELLLLLPNNVEALLRTAKANKSAISLYKKLGFSQVQGMEEVVKQNRIEGEKLEDQRIFMIKSL